MLPKVNPSPCQTDKSVIKEIADTVQKSISANLEKELKKAIADDEIDDLG